MATKYTQGAFSRNPGSLVVNFETLKLIENGPKLPKSVASGRIDFDENITEKCDLHGAGTFCDVNYRNIPCSEIKN